MAELPDHTIEIYRDEARLPAEAEELFETEFADSRKPLPADRPDRRMWSFTCICAVTGAGHVLGGAHLDLGPINFGPLAKEKFAYLEYLFVRPQYRRRGLGTTLFCRAVEMTKAAGCQYIRCNVNWNLAEITLFRKCGFTLADIQEPGETGRYFAVKPLQSLGCNV